MRFVLLHCMSPLLAQSGHPPLHRTCPLSGGKADMTVCGNPLSRSIRAKAHMKLTSRDFGIGAFGALENSLVIEVIGWLDARQKHWQPAHWARSPGNWRVLCVGNL